MGILDKLRDLPPWKRKGYEIAERTSIVNDDVVNKERELLTNIAEADGGDYDVWEAAVD